MKSSSETAFYKIWQYQLPNLKFMPYLFVKKGDAQ